MKRRILLVVGTFAVLVLAYLAYDLAGRGGLPGRQHIEGPKEQLTGRPTTVPGVGEVRPGPGPVILDHDENYNLRARYAASAWEKVGQMLHVTAPSVEWYLPGGETVYIDARRGVVKSAYVGNRYKVLNGELEGDVWVIVDRSRDPRRKRDLPLADRSPDRVRIHLEQVRFDRDQMTIQSDQRVKLFSHEVDLLGEGLFVAWSEAPRRRPGRARRGELREFRIDRGEWMCIRQGQDRVFRQMWLPGGVRAQRPAPPPGGPSAAAVGAPGAPLPAIRSAPALWLAPMMLATTNPARAAATAPAAANVPDTYDAQFNGDVSVTYGEQYLRGADTLRLVFEFQRSQLDELQQAPSTQPSAAAAEGPPGRGEPAQKPPPPPEEPLIVTWSGPLVVVPLSGPEPYVEKRLDVSATGARLELAKGDSKAICRSFEFYSRPQARPDLPPRRWGKLLSAAEKPVRLEMEDGSWFAAPEIRFDQASTTVDFTGPGQMHLPASAGGGLGEAAEGGELTIEWAKSVAISFGELEVVTPEGKGSTDYLRRADFAGDVRVRQGARALRADELAAVFHEPREPTDPINRVSTLSAAGGVHMQDERTGDYIRSDWLEVMMSQPGEGKQARPRWATAKGNVSARQKQTDLAARELTVTFGPVSGSTSEAVEPKRLDASGAVKIVDRSGAEPVTAEAESLTTDPVAKTATLFGKPDAPATVTHKDYYIEGAKVFLKQSQQASDDLQTATVTGAGKLRFYAEEDLSGNKADQPVGVQISWKKELKYEQASALIDGTVLLKTGVDVATGAEAEAGGDELACERLTVQFATPAETEGPASAEGAVGRARTPGEEFRARKIALVRAAKGTQKVRFQSQRKQEGKFLLSRITLWSDELVYDPDARRLVSPGPGQLQLEDYRQPKDKAAEKAADILGGGEPERPSQTGFGWSKSMDLQENEAQKEYAATMSGKVVMVHRTGTQVLLKDRLDVQPWPSLPAGRITVLNCENLKAHFDAGDEMATTAPSEAPAGPRVGPLKLFDADTDVHLRDTAEGVTIGGDRIFYVRTKDRDVAKIMGAGRRLAQATYFDKATRRWADLRAPLIIWNRDTNGFRAVGAEVTGGR